ncbi:MAG: hypothetical protein MJA31_15175, partial [Clostridia bacterium]|nr:hypothetical protein [Clostridia bacterium]
IIEQLIEPEKERYAINNDEEMADADGVVAEYIDQLYNNGARVLHDEDIIYSLSYQQNLSVMLYEALFEPNSSLDLEVQYFTNATIDREKSEDFTNTFVYLLNPAKGWAKFGELDIVINMSDRYPYIIDSSIPLEKGENGGYTASLNGLPEDDLIFTTYTKEEITFIDRTKGRLFRNYFGTLLLLIIVGVVILAAVIYSVRSIIRNNRKRL